MPINTGTNYTAVIRVDVTYTDPDGGLDQSNWDMTSVINNPDLTALTPSAGTIGANFSVRDDATTGGWTGTVNYLNTAGGVTQSDTGPFTLLANKTDATVNRNNGTTATNQELVLIKSVDTGNYYLICQLNIGGGAGALDFTKVSSGGNPAIISGNAFTETTYTLADNANTAPCFLAGTRLLTRSGYRAVEELQVGDEVQTLNQGWQAIRWLGHRTEAQLANGKFHVKSQPIRIAAHAFGPDLPSRDLWVSPDHAVFFRNHLIPAKSLVNGENVVRDAGLESVTYYHVLLDQHAVIFSEGLPTESYVPQENLDSFDNSGTCPEALRSDIVAPIGLYTDCYPRASQGGVVETARAFLARDLADTPALAAA